MAEKGYTNIDDFCGKLKEWSKEGAALSRATKKNKGLSSTSGAAGMSETSSSRKIDEDMFMMVTALLVLMLGILLADKFGMISI
jgi:hypothetical protein